jgi:hypothetical protein
VAPGTHISFSWFADLRQQELDLATASASLSSSFSYLTFSGNISSWQATQPTAAWDYGFAALRGEAGWGNPGGGLKI